MKQYLFLRHLPQAAGPVVIGLSMVLLFLVLKRNASRPATRDEKTGDITLQFPGLLTWLMGAIAVLVPVGISLLAMVLPAKNDREEYAYIIMSVLFLFGSGACWAYLVGRRTRMGTAGIVSEYTLLKPKEVKWEEIVRLKIKGNQELLLFTQDGRKASIHMFLIGSKEALPLLRLHLPSTVQQSYRTELETFHKLLGESLPHPAMEPTRTSTAIQEDRFPVQ